MDIILAILTILSLTTTGSIAQEVCPERDPSLTTCERSCTPDSGCRKAAKKCECAGECGWSCIRQGCESLSAPENGNVTIDTNERSIGSTATYTCNAGYVLQGASTRTCLENKTWSGVQVSCECTKNNEEVSRLELQCARTCPSDGNCQRLAFSCVCDGICGKSCIPLERENYCDTSLLSTNHATYTVAPETAVFGSIAQYTCADGFSPSGGDSERTCSGGGRWSGNAVVCTPNPGYPFMSDLIQHGGNSLDHGAITDGAQALNPSDNVALENACYDPPVVVNGRHNGSKEYYFEGELLVYSCDDGYARGGSSIPFLRCYRRGEGLDWGNFDMTCLPKSCGPPDTIAHGRIEGRIYTFRSIVTYVCDIGYRIQGLAERYCQADQEWTGFVPQCIAIPASQQCTMSQDPSDGRWVRGSGCIDGQNQFPGCELSYTCNEEYVPANTGVVYVCSGPAWNQREEPLCREATLESQQCSMPLDPLNGRWVEGSGCQDEQSQFPAGCELSYTCNEGYESLNTGVVYVCRGPAWNKMEEPLCIKEGSCDNLVLPGLLEKDESVHGRFTDNGSWIQVKCKNNLKLIGGHFRLCENEKWRGNTFCE